MRGLLSVVASATAGLALLCTPVIAAQSSQPHAATIVVTNTNDSGPGSLRQALADANDGDTIQFDPALNGQTIMLTSGELAVNNSITITGPGDNLLAVSKPFQSNFRIFHVTAGHTVTMEGLTIKNGYIDSGQGAGILIEDANLTVNSCTISNNNANNNSGGGSIAFINNSISYSLNIIHSTVINNTGGGINNYRGMLAITDSTISGNQSSYGGALYGGAVISNSTISYNRAAHAGGIYADGPLTISNSSFYGNYTFIQGGRGGALWLDYQGSTATITNCIISGNSATDGGGLYLNSSCNITNSSIGGNTASLGGGIYGGGNITNSTINGNSAQTDGAGIYGAAIVSNSTISGNVANHSGGGIYGGGTITNTTFSGNTANSSQGGAIYAIYAVDLKNTILNGASGGTIFNSGTTVTSEGYNLSSDNGGGYLTAPGDQINTNPMLGGLQNNGGPTSTHALLPGSPAIDTGDPNFTPPPFTDQRGYPRVSNGRIDKGSFEVQVAASPTPAECSVLYDQTDTAGSGGTVSQNFETVNNAYDAQGADDFVVPVMQNYWMIQQVKVNGIYFNGPGPAASANVTFYFDSAGFPGSAVQGGTFNNLSMSDTAGSFTIPLPSNLIITAGTYWVSVQANIDFDPFGEWAWSDRTVASNSPALWQNPGGGFATPCTTYGRRGANCGIDPGAPDQVFQILGCTLATTPITISGTVSYCSNPSPDPVPNVALTLSGSASGMSSSDASGNYLFSVPSGGNYTVTPAKAALPPGSSGINTTDVVAVQRHFLNLGTPLSGCRLTAADVNSDSAINTVDVVAIQRFFLAQSTGTANVGSYKFTPTNRTYQGIVANQPSQNYDTLVLGDVATPFVH